MSSDALSSRIQGLLEPAVRASGADLEDVAISRAGRRSLVRVTVDADGGLDLDQVAEVSRSVSGVLDSSDLLGDDPWTLEVGTRGVATPLTLPRHWRRNVGHLVKVSSVPDVARPEIVARLVEADDASAVLRDDDSGEQTVVPFASVAKAVVQVEFKRRHKEPADEVDDVSQADDVPDETEEG